MKKSNKPNIGAGLILLLVAAFFTITILTQLIDLGSFGPGKDNFIYQLGNMLSSTYGYSSILIPVFLFIAAISCFVSNWNARKSMRLVTALIPFFTAVGTEKICDRMLENSTDDFLYIKMGLTVLIGVMLIVIELLAAGIIADRIFKNSNPKEDEETDDQPEEAENTASEKTEYAAAEPESQDTSKDPTVENPFTAFDTAVISEEKKESPFDSVFDEPETKEEKPAETPAAEPSVKAEKTPAEKTEPEKEPVSSEKEEEYVAPKDDPFAHVFDDFDKPEEEKDPASIITQEEYAALSFKEDDFDNPEEKTAEEKDTEISWPDTTEIKLQAGNFHADDKAGPSVKEEKASETPVKFSQAAAEPVSDESASSKNDESAAFEPAFMNSADEKIPEDAYDVDNDYNPDEAKDNLDAAFDQALSDFDVALEDSENEAFGFGIEEETIDDDDDITPHDFNEPVSDPAAEIENSVEPVDSDKNPSEEENTPEADESSAPEETKPATELSADFFDIDPSTGEEVVVQPEDEDSEQPEENQDSEEVNESASATRFDFSDKGFGIANDVFADMAADAKDELESGKPYTPDTGFAERSDTSESEASEENDSDAENSPSVSDETNPVNIEETFETDAEKTAVDGGINLTDTTEVPVRKAILSDSEPKTNRAKPKGPYKVPTDLLEEYEDDQYWVIDETTKQDAVKLKDTLNQFGISAEVIGIKKGPVVTMFEIAPAPGVKLSRIVSLQDNIALSLAASSVRIVAPIPGKAAVGIEVPNKKRSIVSFREMIEQDLPEFKKMAVPVILGKDILGKSQIIDIAKTPHLLIAGATGAGKSVCVNSIILSILYKRSPKEVKMILVDPKVVELKLYNDIPHLLTPVITEPKKAIQSLQWCLCEMERRYALLDQLGVRDISNYNKRIEERNICTEKLPYIVVIIDEFADLMATSGRDLESIVARLTAMSRAVGIHLVLATQRPSVNVITGLIKANIPSRIAFMVSSRTDSNIIIDSVGAEKLLGKGDMLYASAVDPYPTRIQGTFESDNDVEAVVNYVKTLGEPDYIDDEIFVDDEDENDIGTGLFNDGSSDPLYEQALDIVIQSGKASASYLQRRLKIGYNRAARLVEEMEERGIVGPANGSKPREIIHVPS